MRLRLLVVAGVLFIELFFVSAAAADIRPDPVPPKKAPVTEPPPEPVVVEQKGCAARTSGVEWLFGAGMLAAGLAGLRRVRPRRAAEA